MHSKLIFFCSAIVLCAGLVTSVSINDTETKANLTGGKERSGRWYNEKLKSSVPLGYYASPDAPVYSIDNAEDDIDDDSRNDKAKYNLPTSFADFKPDNKKSQYNFQNRPSSPSGWKGYYSADMDYPSPWMFPSSDISSMISAIKGEDEPTGLLAKLKAEPIALVLAVVLPLSVLLAGVLPSLMNFFMNGNSGVPTITTSATGDGSGNGGKRRRSDNPSFVASVLDAVESLGSRSSTNSSCIQKTICEASKSINGTEFKRIQRNVFDALPSVDESWLQILGLKEFKHAMNTGNCEIIQCSVGYRKKEGKRNEQAAYEKNELNK